MQLYKSRGFSEFFQDTFAFVKKNGKHFFKHFFIVNGIFLLILMIFGYFFTKFYTELMFSGINNPNDTTFLENYMNENGPMFFLFLMLFLIVALIAGIISYSYTPIYLKLYNEKGGKGFNTKEIIDEYKNKIGDILLYLIVSIFMAILLIIPLGIIMFVLAITFVGILLWPLAIAAFALIFGCALMEFLEGKRGIMSSFSYAWELITSKFWAAVGSVGLFYFMSYVIQNIVSLIPYFFGVISFMTSIEERGQPDTEEISSFFTIMLLMVFFISFVLGTILNNIVQLNQGIVFYSLKEEKENINTQNEIDLIGSGEA